MPTQWKRSPEELHKTYIANTEAFYRAAGRGFVDQTDEFCMSCATQLFARSAHLGEEHVAAVNELYSKGQPRPKWLLWALSKEVCSGKAFLPPLFFWKLTEQDAKEGTGISRIFIRMLTNILLCLAAVDDDVTYAEAEYITECTDKLSALCDSAGVKKGKPGLRAADFVTSSEPPFTDASPPLVPGASVGNCERAVKHVEVAAEKPSLDELMAELDALVGLQQVKTDVKSMMNLIKIRKLRQENHLPAPLLSLHMVFTGNPGTGKTTVARLLGKLYAAIGVLSRGQLVEVDRSGLVAGYVGQTAIKTQEVIGAALGGVLFVDEAYALATGGENDFGREAIETILKAMEDHRDELVVIVAGYSGPMEIFLSSNPGLESRFNKYIEFPDYTGEELNAIFHSMCAKNGYKLDQQAEAFSQTYFQAMYNGRDENFGNGRDVRNQFEDMVVRQANRVAAMEAPTKEDLVQFIKADFLPESDGAQKADSRDSSE